MDTHVSVMESSTNGINWNINIITNMLLEIIQGQGGVSNLSYKYILKYATINGTGWGYIRL